jgi:hypothetical protein
VGGDNKQVPVYAAEPQGCGPRSTLHSRKQRPKALGPQEQAPESRRASIDHRMQREERLPARACVVRRSHDFQLGRLIQDRAKYARQGRLVRGGEGGIRTHVPRYRDHLISSQRRYDRFGTSPNPASF